MSMMRRRNAHRIRQAGPAGDATTAATGIPPWRELQRMGNDELAALAAQHNVDFNGIGRMKAASALNRKRSGQ